MNLTDDLAARLAAIPLGHVRREYPHKLDHVLNGDADALPPSALHPIFHGSFDWHSCVHGYWLLARLLKLRPGHARAEATRALFAEMLTEEKVAGELAYLARPSSEGFERPYGWAWALALHGALEGAARQALTPLAHAFAARFKAYLPKLTYPIRHGTHANTAFALLLAHRWGEDAALSALIEQRARDWYWEDRAAQAWEPSGDDFLSPTLVEAACMAEVLPAEDFAGWFARFLPEAGSRLPATLFAPVVVSDRTDGKIAHLDGLNLSRAWCWRAIAPLVPELRTLAEAAAEAHLAAALPHIDGHYAGSHWLASFALLAMEGS